MRYPGLRSWGTSFPRAVIWRSFRPLSQWLIVGLGYGAPFAVGRNLVVVPPKELGLGGWLIPPACGMRCAGHGVEGWGAAWGHTAYNQKGRRVGVRGLQPAATRGFVVVLGGYSRFFLEGN